MQYQYQVYCTICGSKLVEDCTTLKLDGTGETTLFLRAVTPKYNTDEPNSVRCSSTSTSTSRVCLDSILIAYDQESDTQLSLTEGKRRWTWNGKLQGACNEKEGMRSAWDWTSMFKKGLESEAHRHATKLLPSSSFQAR